MGNKKLLIVCYGGGHVRMISKVLPYLKNIDITIFALTEAQSYLKGLDIPFKTLTDYHEIMGSDPSIMALGKEMISILGLDFTDEESILYYGYGFKELIDTHGKEKAITAYKQYGRWAFLPLNFMRSLFDYEQPDILLTTNSPRMERASLIVAKERQLKNISIEDLFYEENPITKALQEFLGDKNYDFHSGDTVCVMCDRVKEIMIEKGKTEEIIVTGNPNFDAVFEYKQKHVKQVEDRSKKHIVCYISQQTPQSHDVFKSLLDLLDNKVIDTLLLKYHPTEDRSKFDDLLTEHTFTENQLVVSENLHEAVLESNLVISEFSTAGIEAMILGRRLLYKKNNGAIEFENFGNEFGFTEVTDIYSMIEGFYKAYDNGTVDENTFTLPYPAGKQIASVITSKL